MDTNIENALIQKKIISPGKQFVTLKPGTRVNNEKNILAIRKKSIIQGLLLTI